MFTVTVDQQISNFLRPSPLKNHCWRKDIEGELEKANGHSGTFGGLCNTQAQNVRIQKELRNHGPTPASFTGCEVSQVRVETIYSL